MSFLKNSRAGSIAVLNDVMQVARRIWLVCGILSSVLFVAMNVFIAMRWKEYSSFSQTVSELSAIDAPTRSLWVPLGYVYTFLMIAFGCGVYQSGGGKRRLPMVGSLLIAYGIIGLGWPLAPMHLRPVLAAGGHSFSDTMHIAITIVTVVLMLLAMGFGAASFGKRVRFYTIVSMLVLLLFGSLTVALAPGIDTNQPTPWIGVWERINIGVFLLWVVVLSILLLREEKKTVFVPIPKRQVMKVVKG